MASKKSIGVNKEYQARWDLDTLRQAKEIESNAARLRAAQNYAKEQVKMLGNIASPAKKTTSKKK